MLPALLVAVSLQAQVISDAQGRYLPAREPKFAHTFQVILDSPGGDLPFALKLRDRWIAIISNGKEQIEVKIGQNNGHATLDFDHYDSRIEFKRASLLDVPFSSETPGTWTKRTGPDSWTNMNCKLKASAKPPALIVKPSRPWRASPSMPISGRWLVDFSGSDDRAVAVIEGAHQITGTIMTTTGDYRYLSGRYADNRLQLSCFDGAHAFLFKAKMQEDGTLKGDFWSRDSWHETWTAKRDENVELPDGFTLTSVLPGADFKALKYPDLNGKLRSLDDFRDKALIIEVFGSWCPNCYDAAAYLKQLDTQYGKRGLSILGLAFEITGDFKRDSKQVRRFAKHHGVNYPMLIAGLADKKKASKALPILDRVRSYPTFVFLDAKGTVRGVYTGFSGPATGEANVKLRKQFETLIERILAESDK